MQVYSPYSKQPLYSPTPKRPRKSRLRLFLLLAAAIVIAIPFFSSAVSLPHLPHSSKKAAAASRPVLSQAQITQMSAQINAVIAANPTMEVGVAVQDLNSGRSFHYGISDPFIAASVSKVLTAAMYLHGVEAGQYTLDQTIAGYSAHYEIQQMVEQSDNDAWANLNGVLTHDGLEAYASSIGLSNYDPDQNTLTVDDIALLLGKLYKNQLLKPADTQLLLGYMHDANHDSDIVASVPAGVTVYHKAGWLVDREHDAAIIDNGKHPYVLVIFSKDSSGTYDDTVGHQIFSGITTATTKVFL